MAVTRAQIERVLDDFIANEGGMKFQHLAVALGRQRWPELIASERRKDLGLDAHATALLSADNVAKGLASSITPTLKKISDDAEEAKKHFPDLRVLIFVTPETVSNLKQKEWVAKIRTDYGLELRVIEREDIITSLMLPESATLCRNFLGIDVAVEPSVADTIARIRRAAGEVVANWAARVPRPLIELRAVRLDASGAESGETFTLNEIGAALRQNRRLILEGPAGRGKTTTLIQLAPPQMDPGQTAFLVDLPAWVASQRPLLDFIVGTPQFQALGIDAGAIARVETSEHFSFLLNGWNEIGASNSDRAVEALRDIERHFPLAGIIVATRTHHIIPPLPGALRLRLLTLTRRQRNEYLTARLEDRANDLIARLDGDRVLDELTRTPFVLAEVSTLFQAGAAIPSTKIGVLAAVVQLHEQSPDHQNHLRDVPLVGRQEDYLRALATEMTRRGAVVLADAEARPIVTRVARELVERGQIGGVPEPTAVLAALSAHHILERVEYPAPAFRFGHQQFQEHYAAIGVTARLIALNDRDRDSIAGFTRDFVNDPAWAEPLRMVAQALGADEASADRAQGARLLVKMALSVDPVFAAELARLSGPAIWDLVSGTMSANLRAWHGSSDENHRECALAAMMATGSNDFQDIVIPLLSADDEQTRLRTYRLWPEFHVTSLGADWRDRVRSWSEGARADFVSEVLRGRFVAEIALFAADDPSAKVKTAALQSLTWIGALDEAAHVLESMDGPTFDGVAVQMDSDRAPARLRARILDALRRSRDTVGDPVERLRYLLKMAEFGEIDRGGINLKQALDDVPATDLHRVGHYFVRPALDLVRAEDPEWVNGWVAERIADGRLWPEHWKSLVTTLPTDLAEALIRRLETEDFEHRRIDGMVDLLAAHADDRVAERLFASLRAGRRVIVSAPREPHPLEWAVARQLEALFNALQINVAVAGLLAAATADAIDIDVATRLLSRVAKTDRKPISGLDERLKAALRTYLKQAVAVVLGQDDFHGEAKANLASSSAQVGEREDISDLVTLVRADIDRVRRGRSARSAGDRGLQGEGATTSYAPWHIHAMVELDAARAGEVLIELLREPEYVVGAAEELVRLASPAQHEGSLANGVRYSDIGDARRGRRRRVRDEDQRKRYASAIRARLEQLVRDRESAEEKGYIDYLLQQLAKALATLDGESRDLVLDVISTPGSSDSYLRAEVLERLLANGAVLPTDKTLALIDESLAQLRKYGIQQNDRWLFWRLVGICAFVDDPARGIRRMREVIGENRFAFYELRGVIGALGEARRDEALELLRDLAYRPKALKDFAQEWIDALATIETAAAHELLMSFVDPELQGLPDETEIDRLDVLASRIVDLARRDASVEARLHRLCEMDLPPRKRRLLAKVMNWLGTPEALSAALNLLDDRIRPSVPDDTLDQLESAFVEREPRGPNTYSLSARASNEIRARLFEMVVKDERRRKSAYSLLGQIEAWRLEYGRPTDEPRHPALASGQPWPPKDPLA